MRRRAFLKLTGRSLSSQIRQTRYTGTVSVERELNSAVAIEALPARDQRPLLRTIDAYLKGAERK